MEKGNTKSMSYEQSFLNGLDVEELKDKFDSLYSLLKA